MNKQQAVEYLIQKGYNAKLDKGVVTVIVKDFTNYRSIFNLMREAGYDSSMSVKKLIQNETEPGL